MITAGESPESHFTNEPIDVSGLPQLDDGRFESLDPKYLTGTLAAFGAGIVVVLIATVLISLMIETTAVPLIIGGGVALLLLVGAGLSVLEIRRLGYQLRARDVSVRRGVLVHSVATVPFDRVQHVRLQRGPFDRLLGLASVDVNSAGPNISIPGLAVDDAERIKQLITERAGVDDDRPEEATSERPVDPFAAPPREVWRPLRPPSVDR